MTAAAGLGTERLTDLEEAILRAWLGGHQPREIAKARKVHLDEVTGTIDRLCNYQRDIAALALEKGVRPLLPNQPKVLSQPARARPLVMTRPRPSRVDATVPARPVPVAVAAGEPVPADPAPILDPAPRVPGPETPGGIEHLLARAEQLPGRARTLIARIRSDIHELQKLVDRRAAEETARALVAERRRELNEAEKQLHALIRPASRAGGPSAATVRAWAASAGVECGRVGNPSRAVMEAYYAAHPGAAR